MDEFIKGLFFIFRFMVHCCIEVWLYLKLDKIWYKYTKLFIVILAVLVILVIYFIVNS